MGDLFYSTQSMSGKFLASLMPRPRRLQTADLGKTPCKSHHCFLSFMQIAVLLFFGALFLCKIFFHLVACL
jgi:hypothetical protein